jgi:hypothetical protein
MKYLDHLNILIKVIFFKGDGGGIPRDYESTYSICHTK